MEEAVVRGGKHLRKQRASLCAATADETPKTPRLPRPSGGARDRDCDYADDDPPDSATFLTSPRAPRTDSL